jgi:hypothetical protein
MGFGFSQKDRKLGILGRQRFSNFQILEYGVLSGVACSAGAVLCLSVYSEWYCNALDIEQATPR